MTRALNYDPADPDKMNLPAGMTCGDCVHIHRCKAMFGHVESDTRCDWSPSRFQPRNRTKELALQNIMLLAMKRLHKGTQDIADWEAVLRFCKEGGVEPSPLRATAGERDE